jgi:hypothetical protein
MLPLPGVRTSQHTSTVRSVEQMGLGTTTRKPQKAAVAVAVAVAVDSVDSH